MIIVIFILFINSSYSLEYFFPKFYKNEEQVCISKREGCNKCVLEFFTNTFEWSCTELGCLGEPHLSLKDKCTDYLNKESFKLPKRIDNSIKMSCTRFATKQQLCDMRFSKNEGLFWECRHHKAPLQMKKTLCLADLDRKDFKKNKAFFEGLKEKALNKLKSDLIIKKKEEEEQSVFQSCFKNELFCKTNLFPIGKTPKGYTFEEHMTCEEKKHAKGKKDICWNRVIKTKVLPFKNSKPKWFNRIRKLEDNCIHYENKCLKVRLEFTYKKKWEWEIYEKDCDIRPKTKFWNFPMSCLHKFSI